MDDDSKMDETHESNLEDEEMEEGEASDSEVEVAVEYGVEDSEDQKSSITVSKKASRRPTPPYYGPSEDNFLAPSNSARSGFKSADAVEVPVKVLNNRAKRFGVKTVTTSATPQKVKNLYDSLGVEHSDFINGWWRGDLIHMYSADPLPTTAVKQYFRNYAPTSISKISDKHSLICWSDTNSPIRALLGLSCAIAYPDDQVDQPRPPTRRHVEPPGSLMVKVENSKSKEVASKAISNKQKKKKKKKDSSDSSDSDSSNDSDSDSSSSDSSSSDSSSDSDSDSSSDSSDSSSSSSSDSDSNESAKKQKKKIKKSKKKSNGKEEIKTTINQSYPEFKETAKNIKIKEESVKDSKAEDVAKVSLSDIPVKNLPDGKWRLGVPFDNTRAILLRFAHANDITERRKKTHRMHTFGSVGDRDAEWRSKRSRDVDMSDEESANIANDSSRRFAKAARRTDKGVKSRLYEVRKFGDSGPARQTVFEPLPEPTTALPVAVDRSYRDLDDPNEEDGGDKNPWGSLARNWGKKETLPVLNYQSMLKNFVSGEKRKRTPEPERMEEDYDHHHRHGVSKKRRDDYDPQPVRRIAPVKRRLESDRRRHDDRQRQREHSERLYSRSHRSDGEEEALEENEEDSESSEEEVIDWRAKMNLPRMKMYADGEEKRKRKESKKTKSVLLPPNSFDSKNKKNIFSRLGEGGGDSHKERISGFKEDNRMGGSNFRSSRKTSVKSRLG